MRYHHTAYDNFATDRCERVLLTLLGDVGPWKKRTYLAGGLAPRYLVGRLPDGARAHVGTTDVDLIIGLTLDADTPETYRTLHNLSRPQASNKPSRVFDGPELWMVLLYT